MNKRIDNEIKGIKIIEVENMEKYIEGGEILTKVFFYIWKLYNFSVWNTHTKFDR